MLVEDDNNLRAIYGDRLMAEGYDIVSARDGEEALAMAVKEKPHLIISDVMMPKISGFDMLDILRTTPETKDVKVIMMTALSQTEDKERADKLGADKYLVKSQVTLEDVARVVHEVLADGGSGEPATTTTYSESGDPITQTAVPAPTQETAPVAATSTNVPAAPANPFEAPAVSPDPVAAATPAAPTAVDSTQPASAPAQPQTDTPLPQPPTAQLTADPATTVPADTTQAAPTVPAPAPVMPITPDPASMPVPAAAPDPVPATAPAPDPVTTQAAEPMQAPTEPDQTTAAPASTSTDVPSSPRKVIQPITDPTADSQPKIYELYEKEMAEQAKADPSTSAGTVIEAPSTMPEASAPTAAPTPQPGATPAPGTSFDPNSVAL